MPNNVQSTISESLAGRRCARVAAIVERRYLSHAQPHGMIGGLRAMGHSVVVIDPEERVLDTTDSSWTRDIDVAVARGRSWGVLCLLESLERHAVPVINPRAAIAAVHNKAEMTVRLASAGIPIPRTWIGSPRQIARQLLPEDFPVIVKPIFGDNCRGLELVHDREHLDALGWTEPTAIVQRFIPGLEFDLKLYSIGQEVWAVRKPSPLLAKCFPQAAGLSPEFVPLTESWRKLALRCGTVFGLELYGVDCIETENGPLVIEVNEFPNYSAVPGADEKLAKFVLASMRQEK
ncbi:MAG TPA: ATP-grasp domain-containing protein [Candidatus Angelobacter sp.]|nr:ATP-grasp domain-containing protein [Candidatus Angelobacter sp.]